jgi:bifunctional DNA-binding transcriptional regulator/antitoxin component of YhaV-PrlF toxin-antitoxin module
VTSKLQVTIPKAIAERYGIEPGAEIDWLPAGEAIRVVTKADRQRGNDRTRRLQLFDSSTERQRERQKGKQNGLATAERGWSREDLYARGRAR